MLWGDAFPFPCLVLGPAPGGDSGCALRKRRRRIAQPSSVALAYPRTDSATNIAKLSTIPTTCKGPHRCRRSTTWLIRVVGGQLVTIASWRLGTIAIGVGGAGTITTWIVRAVGVGRLVIVASRRLVIVAPRRLGTTAIGVGTIFAWLVYVIVTRRLGATI